nr:Trm112 family protein [Kofleriaceae bacterium]
MLDRELLEVLVCPRSHAPLLYFPRGEADRDEADAFLLCPSARLRYRIEHGVPVLLVDEAEELVAADVQRLVDRAKALGIPGA